ncbi:MAG: F0F1 ATP synthase subunit A [Verrucomicrobiota bacterium]|jgi:F-type H+-transporting ATPase subunit a|nr:MAG: F0F1 ATP synthase subunit A [Verrucomicrobiota bacterium]
MAALQAHAAESGVSQSAENLFNIGPLPVSNSIVTSWVVALVIILVIRLAAGTPKLKPTGGQIVVETLVQGILDLTSPIVGNKVAKATFPVLVTLFTFILIQNWSGLFPGVGTLLVRDHATNSWLEFIRPGNADLNMTFALAIVSFIAWLYFIIRYAGFGAIYKDLFGNKAERSEVPFLLYLFLYVVFFLVGIIEIVSILFRPISLSFRLFGNVYGGENLMHSMSEISKWGLPIPFYFLEMLIGFVQALVFTLLVSVYIGLICNHGDDHAEEDHGSH